MALHIYYVTHNPLWLSSPRRGQEVHIRYDHIYMPEANSQSDVEYAEMKRPRLEMGTESLMRHSSHRPPLPMGGAEDVSKVTDHISHTYTLSSLCSHQSHLFWFFSKYICITVLF